jgi:hypothetical protein
VRQVPSNFSVGIINNNKAAKLIVKWINWGGSGPCANIEVKYCQGKTNPALAAKNAYNISLIKTGIEIIKQLKKSADEI